MRTSFQIFFRWVVILVVPMLFLGLFAVAAGSDAEGVTAQEQLSIRYMRFLEQGVTASRVVQAAKAWAQQQGFIPLREIRPFRPGVRFYLDNRGRALVLGVVGQRPMVQGLRLAVAHADAPHIHLKAKPLYTSAGFVMLQTRYYGGIKKYQWAALPLALVGEVVRVDGTRIDVDLGRDATDPVLVIPDLAPHVDRPYRNRTQRDVFKGEELDPIIGSPGPDAGSRALDRVRAWLRKKYRLQEADLISADLDLVPALKPRWVGVDRNLIGAYGQDDRSGSFAVVQAILDVKETPPFTALALLVDLEEVGSQNNTGAASRFVTDLIRRLLYLQKRSFSEMDLAVAVNRSMVLSVDATTGIHPIFPAVQEPGNAARLGHGVVLKLYGEGFNARPEVVAWVRRILQAKAVPWQTHMYKVDVGGGGTVGRFFAVRNMEVVDVGIPLLGMHSTFSISHRRDLEALVRLVNGFYMERSRPSFSALFP